VKIVSLNPGKHSFGPDNARLLVNTTRTGPAAKAGHDLEIEVTSWSGTVDVGEDPSQTTVALTADGGSLRVLEGKGGVQSLGDDDRAAITQTIDDEILERTPITFRSSAVEGGGEDGRWRVRGDLELLGKKVPTEFELTVADGHLTASATVKQTDLGRKPYSILFGTLKVVDEVRVTVDARI
jgi:YceI-like domain